MVRRLKGGFWTREYVIGRNNDKFLTGIYLVGKTTSLVF